MVASINSGTGSLSGTLTEHTDASGIATFTDLVITNSVTGSYTLLFTASLLASPTVVSNSFTVTNP